MYVENKHALNAARYGGDIHLRYDPERFLVRYSCEFDRIQILEWDGSSYSTMLPRDRSEDELLQVLRDANEVTSDKGYNPWVSIRQDFAESLAVRTKRRQLRDEQVAKRLPRGARRLTRR